MDPGGNSVARRDGILPCQAIRALVAAGHITADPGFDDGQIQPASIDLRLGAVAHRVRASFLPGPAATVRDKLAAFGMHDIRLDGGAVLEKGCVYIVPLMESVRLAPDLAGLANPKSSTGRLDIFTRLITDRARVFDKVAAGYDGPLYAEISPRTFSVLVRPGTRLNQLRFRRGDRRYTDAELLALHRAVGLVAGGPGEAAIAGGVAVSVDLSGHRDGNGVVGWKARRHTGLIDLDKVGHYPADEFWEPVGVGPGGGVVLNPDDFYILASKEAVTVPPDHAAEMVAFDPLVGEFRVHYAGFFDPGFGHAGSGGAGSRAVLEVRSHEVPFLIEDGQTVGRLVYEPLTALPDRVYGTGIGSSYQRQGLQLAKQFRR